ncbi:MAG: PEP-CTERM sorting domain-containing protein [Chthoniobacterales bacterium]|nr:PEP-CTERM sorting domain-containing protein [Chthoniobacterales bacterium]
MKTHTATDVTKKALLLGIITAGLILHTGSAWSAATNTNEYIFSYSQTAGFPDQEMGRLTISDSGTDTVWTLSVNWDNQYNASSPFVFSLNYNMPTGNISQPTLELFDVVGSVGVKSFDNKGVYFQPANSPDRFTDGESASWRFLNTTPAQFTDFELHINSIYDGGSVKFTDYVVPEPSTYALLALGALVTVVACRRGTKT